MHGDHTLAAADRLARLTKPRHPHYQLRDDQDRIVGLAAVDLGCSAGESDNGLSEATQSS